MRQLSCYWLVLLICFRIKMSHYCAFQIEPRYLGAKICSMQYFHVCTFRQHNLPQGRSPEQRNWNQTTVPGQVRPQARTSQNCTANRQTGCRRYRNLIMYSIFTWLLNFWGKSFFPTGDFDHLTVNRNTYQTTVGKEQKSFNYKPVIKVCSRSLVDYYSKIFLRVS